MDRVYTVCMQTKSLTSLLGTSTFLVLHESIGANVSKAIEKRACCFLNFKLRIVVCCLKLVLSELAVNKKHKLAAQAEGWNHSLFDHV